MQSPIEIDSIVTQLLENLCKQMSQTTLASLTCTSPRSDKYSKEEIHIHTKRMQGILSDIHFAEIHMGGYSR